MSDVHTDEDLWLVKLADGRVRSMTVDDMDAALERGELDAKTEVQAPDADEWTTLGVVAGLDEVETPSLEREADATTPLVAAAAKAAFDAMDAEEPLTAASSGEEPLTAASSGEEPLTAASSGEEPLTAAPRVAYDEDDDTPASSNAPSLMPTVASVAPPSSLASLSTPPSSLALDLDDDAAEAALRAGKKRMAFTFAAVAVGLVVCGSLVSWLSGNSGSAPPSAAAVQAPPPVVEAPLAVDPAFEKPALTEEQKKRLAEADKARDAKKAKVAPGTAGGSAPSNGKKGSAESPFHQGGDRFDPLNGSL